MPLADLMKCGIHHIGFVVEDLEKAIAVLGQGYGISGFAVYEFQPQRVWESGEEVFGCKLKIGMLDRKDGCTIEVIQPPAGNGFHRKFLEGGREGLHHVCFSVDDFDYWKESLLDRRIKILFECETEDEKIGFRRGIFVKDDYLDMIYEIKEIPRFRK